MKFLDRFCMTGSVDVLNIEPCQGQNPYLSKCEENELAELIVSVAEKGYGKTRQQTKGIAENYAHGEGVSVSKERKITDGWFKRFMDRQSLIIKTR